MNCTLRDCACSEDHKIDDVIGTIVQRNLEGVLLMSILPGDTCCESGDFHGAILHCSN